MVEIIYKDYLLGSGKITGARGGYVYVNSKNITINVVDALMQLPNTIHAVKIKSL